MTGLAQEMYNGKAKNTQAMCCCDRRSGIFFRRLTMIAAVAGGDAHQNTRALGGQGARSTKPQATQTLKSLEERKSPSAQRPPPLAQPSSTFSLRLHVPTPTARLQSPTSPRFWIDTPAARLQSSGLFCLQRTSSAPCLHVATYCNAPPEFHASVFVRLQRASRPPELYASTSRHQHRISKSPYLHVVTPAARLQAYKP